MRSGEPGMAAEEPVVFIDEGWVIEAELPHVFGNQCNLSRWMFLCVPRVRPHRLDWHELDRQFGNLLMQLPRIGVRQCGCNPIASNNDCHNGPSPVRPNGRVLLWPSLAREGATTTAGLNRPLIASHPPWWGRDLDDDLNRCVGPLYSSWSDNDPQSLARVR